MSEERESVILKAWRNYVVPAAKATGTGVATAAKYIRQKGGEYGGAALTATGVWASAKGEQLKHFCNGFFLKANLRAKAAEMAERVADSVCVVLWIGFEAVTRTRPKRFKYPNPWQGFRWVGPSDHPIYDARYYDLQAGLEHACTNNQCCGGTIPDIRNDPQYKGCVAFRENDFIDLTVNKESEQKGQ